MLPYSHSDQDSVSGQGSMVLARAGRQATGTGLVTKKNEPLFVASQFLRKASRQFAKGKIFCQRHLPRPVFHQSPPPGKEFMKIFCSPHLLKTFIYGRPSTPNIPGLKGPPSHFLHFLCAKPAGGSARP